MGMPAEQMIEVIENGLGGIGHMEEIALVFFDEPRFNQVSEKSHQAIVNTTGV